MSFFLNETTESVCVIKIKWILKVGGFETDDKVINACLCVSCTGCMQNSDTDVLSVDFTMVVINIHFDTARGWQ